MLFAYLTFCLRNHFRKTGMTKNNCLRWPLVYVCFMTVAAFYLWTANRPYQQIEILEYADTQDSQSPSPKSPPVRKAEEHRKPENTTCVLKKHVLFLKTHKCAGSTIQNILYRFGTKHSLDFLLAKNSHYLSWNQDINPENLVPPGDGQYDIITNHVVFSEALTKLLPQDALKITSVRDPATHFESLFDYYDVGKSLGLPAGEAGIQRFLSDTDKFYFKRQSKPAWIFNQMLGDLGMPRESRLQRDLVIKYIGRLDKVFDLVMIPEYFAESIVLMRDLLCWGYEDVMSVVMNKRPKPSTLQKSTADMIYSFNWADKLLYDHFRRKLLSRIAEYGQEKMSQEVAYLKLLSQRWFAECGIKEISSSRKARFKTWSDKALTFDLKPDKMLNSTCVHLITPEVLFTNNIQMAQIARNKKALHTK